MPVDERVWEIYVHNHCGIAYYSTITISTTIVSHKIFTSVYTWSVCNISKYSGIVCLRQSLSKLCAPETLSSTKACFYHRHSVDHDRILHHYFLLPQSTHVHLQCDAIYWSSYPISRNINICYKLQNTDGHRTMVKRPKISNPMDTG